MNEKEAYRGYKRNLRQLGRDLRGSSMITPKLETESHSKTKTRRQNPRNNPHGNISILLVLIGVLLAILAVVGFEERIWWLENLLVIDIFLLPLIGLSSVILGIIGLKKAKENDLIIGTALLALILGGIGFILTFMVLVGLIFG
jgi:hypothetical protein